ncbi:Metabotropic glutamate receptor 8, partial [Durusdinium trenchii]
TASAGATHEFACVCPGPSLTAPDGRYHVDICDGRPLVDELGQATWCARLGECLECPEGMICKGSRDLKLILDANTRAEALQRVEAFCSSYAFADTALCTSRVFCEANLDDVDCEHASPELKAGFWSHSSEPLSVFKCKNELQCIGGEPTGSICAQGRGGTSCGFCLPGHFPDSLGRCSPCAGSDVIPGAFALVAFLLAIIVLGWRMGQKLTKSSKQVISAMIIGTQTGVMIQTLGVFSDLSLVWEEPVRSVLQLMQLVNFDFDIVKMQCYVGTDDPLLNLLTLILVIPLLAAGGALLAALLARWKGQHFSWPKYLNVIGLVFLVLYLSLCMSLTRPIHCKSNPNGLQTMVSSPAVQCWVPGPHVAMAILSIGGLLLYGAGFVAYVAHITWRYPILVNDGHGMKLLVQYRFLFNRFKDHGYYWGLYFIVQKVLIALVPILFPDSAAIQILLLAGFILLYLLAVTYVQPWVTDLANFGDCFLSAGLMFFLLIASFLVDGNDTRTRTVIGIILMFLVLTIATVLGLLVLRALYKKFFPGKMYDMFLCHHKAGAGVLCRWLKSELLRQTNGHVKVFLDSDELEGLADIGDLVKSQSETLVIVASKLILTRPWCAVEICSGVANKVKIVVLKCSDFSFYDDAGFRTLREGWSSSDLLIFAQNSIDPSIIEESYQVLPSKPVVDFNAFAPEDGQTAAVAELLPHAASLRSSHRASLRSNGSDELNAQILILGSTASSEGRMTCQVLKSMVMERLHRPIVFVSAVSEAAEAAGSAKYILVVLTRGLFQDELFLKMLETVDQVDPPLEIVSALADQFFEFPSATFFSELEKSNGVAMVQSVKRVVNILALPFSAQTSIKVMSAQVDELTRRFKFVEMSSSLSFGYRDHFARMISPGAVSTEAAVLDSPGAAVLGDGNEKEFESGKKDEVDTSVYSDEL